MNDDRYKNLEKIINEEYSNTTGIIIMENNVISYEKYFDGYSCDDAIHLASVTKSIISLLIGIAMDQAYIKNLDQKVLEFFPHYKLKRGEKNIQKITIKNLLTMTAPYKYKSEPYSKVYSSDDWTKAALDLLGGKGRIGEFNYSTVGTHILAGILVSATGLSVLEFANKNLFEPLGISKVQNYRIMTKDDYMEFYKGKGVNRWVVDSVGVNTGGWGMALKALDLAKIGQVCLNKGMWNGKQIVDSAWIEESTREHSRWNQLPYGYLWWLVKGRNVNAYAAIGDGGNIIYICPDKKLVVVITSSFKARAKDRIVLIKKHILQG